MSGRLVARGGVGQREVGVSATFAWLLIGDVTPMTWRPADQSREMARAESWLALCTAAGQPAPTPAEWRRLGVPAAPARVEDRAFAYGVWRTLAWLLGVREDWPTYTSWHHAAGIPRPDRHLDVPIEQRDTEQWRAAARAAWERDEADAQRYWRHVRDRVDATDDSR